MTNDVTINQNVGWTMGNYYFPLGFNFTAFGQTNDSLVTKTNLIPTFNLALSSSNSNYQLFYGNYKMKDRGTIPSNSASKISFGTYGSTGNKIAKIQLKNIGFLDEYNNFGTLNDSFNLQYWFYENDHSFEYRFGPSSVNLLKDFSDFFFTGFITNVNFGGNYSYNYFINNLNPISYDSVNSNSSLPIGLALYPSDSTVVRFQKQTLGLNQVNIIDENISYYPNPVSNILNIDFRKDKIEFQTISIYTMTGVSVKIIDKVEKVNKIDLQELSKGNYLILLNGLDNKVYFQISKK